MKFTKKSSETKKIGGGKVSCDYPRDNSGLDVGGVRELSDSDAGQNPGYSTKSSRGGMPKKSLTRGY